MNDAILSAYRKGRLMLLLGAGATMTSTDSKGTLLPSGRGLAGELAAATGIAFSGESLSRVYRAAKKKAGEAGVDIFFNERLRYCRPAPEVLRLAKLPFTRVSESSIRGSSHPGRTSPKKSLLASMQLID